jgi:hypothetical protein
MAAPEVRQSPAIVIVVDHKNTAQSNTHHGGHTSNGVSAYGMKEDLLSKGGSK